MHEDFRQSFAGDDTAEETRAGNLCAREGTASPAERLRPGACPGPRRDRPKAAGRQGREGRARRSARLAAERDRLLAEITARETELRSKQGSLDRARNAAAAARNGSKKKAPVTKAEKKVRAELALLQSERAHVDGTVGRTRDSALIDDSIWNTSHDPETFGKGDW